MQSAADATILHQVSQEEDDDVNTAARANNNNHNLNQHSTIQQHPSATSLNKQVVNSMSNEEQIGLSLSPSPPSTSPTSSSPHCTSNEVINEIIHSVEEKFFAKLRT